MDKYEKRTKVRRYITKDPQIGIGLCRQSQIENAVLSFFFVGSVTEVNNTRFSPSTEETRAGSHGFSA